jgi:hypothetical protein
MLRLWAVTNRKIKVSALTIRGWNECQSIAYRYAGKVADVGEWREGWDYRMWKRVEEPR